MYEVDINRVVFILSYDTIILWGNDWTGEHSPFVFYAAAPVVLDGLSLTLPSLLYVFNQYFLYIGKIKT